MQESEKIRRVGRVAGLWRYPVKSMAEEQLNEADVSWHGLTGDRRWAFVRSDVTKSGFPWLTLRQRADMRDYLPSFTEPDRPDRSPTVVRTPSGAVFDITDSELAEELWPDGAYVIKQDRGIFDTFPLSVITAQSVARICNMVGVPPDVRRFRPNILVEAEEPDPYVEDYWVGSVLRIGGMRMRVDKRDSRCVVINIDPASNEKVASVLRTVADERDGCLGVYGSTVEPGRVTVGDTVYVE